VSDYPWGWAPFHYGRWFTDPFYGPMWLPDYEWGPGWVDWRSSTSYYGWAPLAPGRGRGHRYTDDRWIFVRNRDFGKRDMHNYYVPNARVVNNRRQDDDRRVSYNAGPRRADVERRSGRSIAPLTLRERKEPGQEVSNDQIQLYRPRVQQASTDAKPAPAQVGNLNDVQQRNPTPGTRRQRNTSTQPATTPARQREPTTPSTNRARRQPAQTAPDQPAESTNRDRTTPTETTPARQREAAPPARNRERTPPTQTAPARQRETPAARPQPPASQPRTAPRQNTAPNRQRGNSGGG